MWRNSRRERNNVPAVPSVCCSIVHDADTDLTARAGPACYSYQEKSGVTGSGPAFEPGARLLPPSPQMARECAAFALPSADCSGCAMVVTLTPVPGLPMVRPGDDLAAL